MILRVIVFAYLLFISTSCTEGTVELNIFQIGDKGVTYDYLLGKGYRQSHVDVLMMETRSNDTTIAFEFGYNPMILYSKLWMFKVSGNYIDELIDFFDKHDISLMVPNSFEQIKFDDFFCLKRNSDNQVFFCVLKEEDSYIDVTVIFYYPRE
jgi:hypothetical protein